MKKDGLPNAYLKSLLKAIAVCVFALVILNACYGLTGELISPFWLGVVVSNILIALTVCIFNWNRVFAALSLRRLRFIGIVPGLFLLTGAFSLALITRLFSSELMPNEQFSLSYAVILNITIIPVIEELIFRFYLTSVLRKFVSSLLAGYLGVIVFAAAHSLPVLSLKQLVLISAPVGPILLGGICELLFQRYKSLVYPIFFHACANLTFVVFNTIDARWLEWLRVLYLN